MENPEGNRPFVWLEMESRVYLHFTANCCNVKWLSGDKAFVFANEMRMLPDLLKKS